MNNSIIVKKFAETLVEIDVAVIFNKTIDFNDFINDRDQLLWVALNSGDIVPCLYIDIIDKAFSDLSIDFKGKYKAAYNSALECYTRNLDLSSSNDDSQDDNFVELYKESVWIMQDDRSELKELIGKSDMGFHFGHLYSSPDSEMYWDSEPFDSIFEAEQARCDHNMKVAERAEADKWARSTDNSSNYDHNGEYIPF